MNTYLRAKWKPKDLWALDMNNKTFAERNIWTGKMYLKCFVISFCLCGLFLIAIVKSAFLSSSRCTSLFLFYLHRCQSEWIYLLLRIHYNYCAFVILTAALRNNAPNVQWHEFCVLNRLTYCTCPNTNGDIPLI